MYCLHELASRKMTTTTLHEEKVRNALKAAEDYGLYADDARCIELSSPGDIDGCFVLHISFECNESPEIREGFIEKLFPTGSTCQDQRNASMLAIFLIYERTIKSSLSKMRMIPGEDQVYFFGFSYNSERCMTLMNFRSFILWTMKKEFTMTSMNFSLFHFVDHENSEGISESTVRELLLINGERDASCLKIQSVKFLVCNGVAEFHSEFARSEEICMLRRQWTE